MKRRLPADIWPAFADLMTILAVLGLVVGATALARVGAERSAWSAERKALGSRLREAARNERMFAAIQEAEDVVQRLAQATGLELSVDQSLPFGDDLVAFRLNGTVPIWKADSRVRLWDFCTRLRVGFSYSVGRRHELADFIIVQVEGHTDSSQCPVDEHCNWLISSVRAATFLAAMRNEALCPGAKDFTMRSVGFADSRPLLQNGKAVAKRRISLRLVPDYSALIGQRDNVVWAQEE